jgi:RNA-directed DNA polymerase
MVGWIETKLESWMGLEINREKTRVVKLRQKGASLDFLGYTFRYDRSRPQWGRHRYLNVVPSKQALAREIGIGGAVARSPLPHHRTYGTVYGGSVT